jgi:hypothetical protein
MTYGFCNFHLKLVLFTLPDKVILFSADFFQKPPSAVLKESLKASSILIHVNEFLRAAENFTKKTAKISRQAQGLRDTCFMGTSGFQKLFYDCTNFLNSLNHQQLNLRTPAAFGKTGITTK